MTWLTVAAHLLGGGGCAALGAAAEHPDAARHDVVQPGAVLPAGLDVTPKTRPKYVCAGRQVGRTLVQMTSQLVSSIHGRGYQHEAFCSFCRAVAKEPLL